MWQVIVHDENDRLLKQLTPAPSRSQALAGLWAWLIAVDFNSVRIDVRRYDGPWLPNTGPYIPEHHG